MLTSKKEKVEYLNDLKNYTRVDLENKKYSGISWIRIELNKKFLNPNISRKKEYGKPQICYSYNAQTKL